jgi:phospholipid/cholesterol/gamma-HCH transport system substrate-binding protein
MPASSTTSEVDLDQLFNTLDAPTRKGLQNVIQGSAAQYKGYGPMARRAFVYLNPAIATASMLFRELNRDTPKFTRFVVNSGNLVSDLAQRSSDLSGLVQNLGQTTGALAAQRSALAQSIQRLPGFMALADTTFVNLRSALDDLKPLVDASRPVAPKLRKLLVQLRPLAQDAVPTVRDLSSIVNRAGANNDLTDLVRLGVPLANSTVRPITANGARRPGAFPESVTALNGATPELAYARPYAVDLPGWFEGFSHPGVIDANGAVSRVVGLPNLLSASDTGLLNGLPLGQQLTEITKLLTTSGLPGQTPPITAYQGDRCPGSMERGALWYPETGYPCNPNQVPTGP